MPKKPPSNANRLGAPKRKNADVTIPILRRLRHVVRRTLDPLRGLHAAFLSIALLLVHLGPAQAQGTSATEQFRSGSSAFQAGDYSQALDAFEAALAGGMSGPAVHFNIGVAAYKIGRYDRAEAAFKEVARTPSMAGLAYYNLGLVELRRNNSAGATQWFTRVEQATTDEKIRALAAARLADAAPVVAERPWFGYASFGIGHDDNVALISNSDVLGISDSADNFAEAQIAVSYPLADAWRLDAGAMAVDYQDLDAFDQLGLQGGGRYRWAVGEWTNDVSLQLTHTLLDGSNFENRRSLQFQTGSDLRDDLYLRARYRFSDVKGYDDFRGLSGQRHEAGASLDWTYAEWDIGAEYDLEIGNYDDETLAATRHQLRFSAERTFLRDWIGLVEISRRHSRYDAGGSEDRSELSLAVTRVLSARWNLVLRNTYTDNDADVSEFNYRGNRLSLGIEATL